MQLLHQIVSHQIVRYRLHVQYHATAENRRQQRIHVRSQQHDHCILGRLLQCFQDCILRLGRHLLCLIHNIDLIRAAVRLDGDIVVDLRTDIVHADGIRLLVADVNDVRLIVRQRLLTGMTFLAWLRSALFTLQGHGEYSGNEFLAGRLFTVNNISMGNLFRRNGIL